MAESSQALHLTVIDRNQMANFVARQEVVQCNDCDTLKSFQAKVAETFETNRFVKSAEDLGLFLNDVALVRHEQTMKLNNVQDGDVIQIFYHEKRKKKPVAISRMTQSPNCSYCGQTSPGLLLQCEDCQHWFCNCRNPSSMRHTHVVHHLMTARHSHLSFHPESQHGRNSISCCEPNCGATNLFTLGVVVCDGLAEFVCREHVNDLIAQKNGKATQSVPLVSDGEFLTNLVSSEDDSGHGFLPPEGQVGSTTTMKQAIPPKAPLVSLTAIRFLEELWKYNASATLSDVPADIDNRRRSTTVMDVNSRELPLQFTDGKDYFAAWTGILKYESETQRQDAERTALRNANIQWQPRDGGVHIGRFQTPYGSSHIQPSDELTLSQTNVFQVTAKVISVSTTSSGSTVTFSVKANAKMPIPSPNSCDVAISYNDVVEKRVQAALERFRDRDDAMSAPLYQLILDGRVPDVASSHVSNNLTAPHLPKLNESQAKAVQYAMNNSLSLLHGPPGTGKTVTLSTLIYHLCKVFRVKRVLVCSSANVAVDHVADRLRRTGLDVVRVLARSREDMNTQDFHLNERVKKRANLELEELIKLRRIIELGASDEKRFWDLRADIEEEILKNADVICCTCAVAGDPRIRKYHFGHVVIDEATHTTEPESLIPLTLGAKHVILAGDHCQLGPLVKSPIAQRAGLARTLFERLVDLGIQPHLLCVQYRMHPAISRFSTERFYRNVLQDGVTPADRDSSKVFPWPDTLQPIMFYHSSSPEEHAASAVAYLNRGEGMVVQDFVTMLLKSKVQPADIGVITPYDGQKCHILSLFEKQTDSTLRAQLGAVEVASVDAFQGREKEFIVFSCVRSNKNLGIGFLDHWKRLNVAITRARRGLLIVGNCTVLSQHVLWHALVSHFKEKSLLKVGTGATNPVQWGPADNIELPNPKPMKNLALLPPGLNSYYHDLVQKNKIDFPTVESSVPTSEAGGEDD